MRTAGQGATLARMTYVTQDPYMHPPRRRSRALLVAGVVAGAGVLVATIGAIFLLTRAPAPANRSAPAAAGAGFSSTMDGSAPTTPAVQPATPRVAALIAKLGCKGGPIGTQLYSRETGRCTLGRVEVTIATFDSDALRDRWVDAAREYGGNMVVGPRWAAMVETPTAAGTVAGKLGGGRL